MNDSPVANDAATEKQKIVITKHYGSVVKGFWSATPSIRELSDSPFPSHQAMAQHCVKADGTPMDVDWSTVKAVFFVSTFEGDRDQETVRFYANGPQVGKDMG